MGATASQRITPRSVASVEDDVHWLLSDQRLKRWTAAVLRSSFRVSHTEKLEECIAALRPRCKLPGVVLDVIFQLRSQVVLSFQPIHYSVLYSSPSLVQKLLHVAERASNLYTTEECQHSSISPLFCAVLFADREVVDVLRSHGACFNHVDAISTMRLQTADLWADVQERLIHLHLEVEAEDLENNVEQMRRTQENAWEEEVPRQMNAGFNAPEARGDHEGLGLGD